MHSLRWLLLPVAVLVSQFVAGLIAFATFIALDVGFAVSCRKNLVAAWHCTGHWAVLVPVASACIGAASFAALAVASCAWVAPSNQSAVARFVFFGGATVATCMGVLAPLAEHGGFAAASVSGIAAGGIVAWRVQRRYTRSAAA